MSPGLTDKLLVLAVGTLTLGVAFNQVTFHGDTFFYLAAGDWVLEHGALPGSDPFSFTSVPDRWILHFPLLQVGLSLLTQHLGLQALHPLSCLVGTLALLLLWLPRGASQAQRLIGLAPLALLLLVDEQHFIVRGQLFGHLYFALLLVCLLRLQRGARVPWWVPACLTALWVNSHPSFLLAPLLPLAFAAASLLEPPQERPALRAFVSFALVSLLATGLTPYGYALPLDVLAMLRHRALELIFLFRSPDFHQPGWIAALVLAAGTLVARMRAGPQRMRRSDVALLLVFTMFACYSRRYLVYLAAWEVVLLAKMVDEPGRSQLAASLRRRLSHVTALAVVAAFAGAAYFFSRPRDLMQHAPVAAAERVEQLGLPDNVLNLYPWGGYLSYRWKGTRKVFIDGRVSCFPESALLDYVEIKHQGPNFETLLDLYAIRTVIWAVDTPLDQALRARPAWREVFRDHNAVVYLRVPGPPASGG